MNSDMSIDKQERTFVIVFQDNYRHLLNACVILCFIMLMTWPALAQQDNVTKLVYDNNGRLRAIITLNGQSAVYDYDSAGNLTGIRRLGPNDSELLSFTPGIGAIGDRVTLYGVGIDGVNSLTFNGVVAQIIDTVPTQITAVVPSGATTGPIMLQTTRGLVTSAVPFIVKGIGVSPMRERIVEGEQLQFTANVSTNIDVMGIKWSVNDVEGGSAAMGTISSSGLYTAPWLANSVTSATFIVRATSIAEPDLFREVEVIVQNLSTVRTIVASPVSISLPVTVATTTESIAAANAVSVRTPVSISTISESFVSPGVGVSVNLPSIDSVMPVSAPRGSVVKVTITGKNLTDVTALRFFTLVGVAESAMAASNLTVATDGSSITATVTISGSATTGRRLIVVTTPTLSSLALDTTNNTFEIRTQ